MKTYYTIYQVTNKVNGKIYIGSHKTNNLDDGYMGSGKYLRYAQEKHGIENFEKKILFVFDNPADMYAKEAELVDIEFIAENNTYNLKVGGFGGWDYVNSNLTKKQIKERALAGRHATDKILQERYGNNWRKSLSELAINGLKEKLNRDPEYLKRRAIPKYGKANGMHGKTHSKSARENISASQTGTGNSQYGTMWIYSELEKKCMKIKKCDQVPEGWKPGRVMKFK